MSSLVSLHLDNVEYNADRIARLFPKCKPKNNANLSNNTTLNGDTESSNANQITSIDINRNPVPVGDKLDDDCTQLMDNAGNAITHDRRSITDNCDKQNEQNNVGCNGTSNSVLPADNDDSGCSRASSPFDMSDDDDDSEETSSPPHPVIVPSTSSDVTSSHHSHHHHYHHQQQQQQQQHHNHHHGHNHHHHHHQQQQQQQPQQQQVRRKVHKIPPAAHQYKLRDSRIIEIAGGREVFSQSRSKACRKSRSSFDSEKIKSPGRVWELRARMSEDKKHENTREITETVFSSEIKSVKHPQTISLGINGSVIFDDIDENWKSDNSTHIPQRTYHYNNLSHNSNKESKLASKVDSGEGAEKNTELNKISAPHVIGSLPIAEYEGSPRRYGLRTTENIMPTLLSSPTVTFPRPGFPQRILDESPIASVSSVTTSLPSTTTSSSFNYLYEYSETRKVLEEFFKPDDTQDKAQQFRELEYELKRRRRTSFDQGKSYDQGKGYDQGSSYVGLRLAEARDGNLQSSPRKHSQDSSEYSNNQDQGFLSNYTVSTENLGLPLEFQMSSNSKNLVHHNRYSISPDLEKRFGQSRNFTLSPETTDCESNFGEGDSDVSSLMLIMDPDIGNSGQGPMDRLYPSMPVLEDGLSSGHTSDNENNNATVLLMKKQITEIEREIIEKSNRSTACSVSSTTTAPITVSSISQSNFTPQSANVPSTSLSVHSAGIDKISESRNNADIDLDSLDPLSGSIDRRNPSPPPPAPAPHRESRNFHQSSSNQTPGGVEATIKDIRMTLQRTKTLPLRPSCVINGDNDDRESCNSNKSETPIWVPRKGVGSGPSADEDEPDTDLETDRLLGEQRTDDQGFFDEKNGGWRKKSRSLLPFGLGGQISTLGTNTTTTVTSQSLSVKKSPGDAVSTNGGLSLSPVQNTSPPSSPSISDLIDNGSTKKDKENGKKKNRNKEVLIEGVLFRARYLGSTQLVCEGQPTKATRMMQAEEAVSRIKVENHHAGCKKAGTFGSDTDDSEDILGTNLGPGSVFRLRFLGSVEVDEEEPIKKKPTMMKKRLKKNMVEEAVIKIKAPDGESQPSTEVDLFISTEKIMVLNTDLKEIMMDHALRTISYIADIGDLVVLMARRRFVPHDVEDPPKINRTPKMICHVFESEEAQFIAQSIGQAFQVAYMEFLKANGIEDHSFVKEMDYQEVLNSQEIFGDELQMFAKKELQKEVVVPKMKGEILGVVIVESGWGSMLPTVVIANLAPSGAAARCGQLNIGDQIIAVNGVSLVGLPLSTCQNYIKNSKPHTVVKLTVVPCAPVVEVKIKRPDTKYQLGFSVQNGVICSLLRGGIAERGGVRVGHRIIEINNQSVVAVPHEKIVTLLATSVGEILMKTMPTSMFRLLTGQETPVFI
ncbi:protein lin-10-like isoform X2 [Planococcus citri]|uniref:protein lin-10-like isoform X2 n=1 Tax=Planococcus citri TaxID=170843 RepID=UPI0031F997BD